MKLIIDICKGAYDSVVDGHLDACLEYFTDAIKNGIPLPKGHGRMIDADALKKDDEVTEWLSLNAVRTGKMLKSFSELFIKKIDATPTIIEADKEYEIEVITRGNCILCGKELTEGLFLCKECEAKAVQGRK